MEKSSKNFTPAARLKSFGYALKGIKQVIRREHNFRIHLVMSLAVIIAGFLFRINHLEWMFVIVCLGMVLITEIVNTAIETMVDWVSPGLNEKAGMIKDISAAAVLISAIVALVTGLLIFIPHIIRWVRDW